MPRMHLNDLWTNTCGLVSRRGTCFWDGSVMHVQRSVKSVRRKAKRMYYVEFENVSVFSNRTTRRRPRALFASLGTAALSYSSFSTRTSQCCGCIYTLSSPLFSCQAPSSFFLTPITIFAIWRRDNESASAATALRTINLRKWDWCLRTSHTFNCIPDHDKLNS